MVAYHKEKLSIHTFVVFFFMWARPRTDATSIAWILGGSPDAIERKKKIKRGREIIRKAGLEETEVNTNRNEKKYNNNNNNIINNNNNYKDWGGLWLRGLLEWIKSVSSESQEIDLSHYIVVTRLLYIYNNSVYL